ncbi:MAG: EAL domain-containing protein [Mariprofundaceae bacterium]|nr:EAL domain-containing protein [Mariprofundaceae bacterium]
MNEVGIKILVVDDIEDNLLLLEEILDHDDYNVVKANSGQQALDILGEDADFALILMDVLMPDMDGFATVSTIKANPAWADISVVFITALTPNDLSISQGYEYGAVDFIIKPIDVELLEAKVETFCAFYRQKKLLENEIQQRQDLMRQLQLSSSIFENSGEGIMVLDAQGLIQVVNPAFLQHAGYAQPEMINQHIVELHATEQHRFFYEEMWVRVTEMGFWEGEVKSYKKNGQEYPEWLKVSSVLDAQGVVSHYIATYSDINAHANAKQKLYYLAHYDALTELPNRVLFQETLKHAAANVRRNGGRFALFFMDLDRFKVINDTLGHSAGDLLLQEVAGRLFGCIRESDMLSRQGGDEFTSLLLGLKKAEDAGVVAEKMIKALAEPVLIQGQELTVTTSVGISIFPDDTDDIETLLKYADTSMYHAKDQGRNRYAFYSQDVHATSSKRLNLESKLRKALENEEFELHYQPKYAVGSGVVTGMEALVRWNQPELGRVAPLDFIPLAEETGLIVPIGEWILDEACRQNKTWQEAGFPCMRMAVNLSSRQFKDGNMLKMVDKILHKHHLEPDFLELELTESMIMQDAESTIKILQALHGNGIQLAIDDFGTGYSSLSYLKRFPISKLKLDRSFIIGLPDDKDDSKIVTAMITLAHGLDMTVIAEGVETREQLAWLEDAGCDEIQGYFFNAPMSSQDFTVLLQKMSV